MPNHKILISLLALLVSFVFVSDSARGGQTIKFGPVVGGIAGRLIDNDSNGLYESAYLWDADGDGSFKVTCTAKDAPDLACKVAGEVIYRDFADDMNCAVHGCGFGQMEKRGTIYLEEAVVYVNWPCWDAGESAGFNDPAATNDALHDNINDAAFLHCPKTPDFASSARRFSEVNFLAWQGNVVGAGVDTRNPETTTNYKRDTGTYIVDDRGPRWNSGASSGDNSWWSAGSGFIRGIGFGFSSTGADSGDVAQSGEYAADGDSKGFSFIEGNQLIGDLNGSICVCNELACGATSANWVEGLVAGDVILVQGVADRAFGVENVLARLRVRDTPTDDACQTNAASIPIGGIVGVTLLTFATDPPLISRLNDGQIVVHARSDYMNPSTVMSNITFEPQDWYNETGGDCDGTGVWTLSVDGASTDYDCDTNPTFGFWGGGDPGLKDVVLRHWHSFVVDGAIGAGSPWVDGVRFFYGMGAPIGDFAGGWRLNNVEVHDTQFATGVISIFGPDVRINGLGIYNVAADTIAAFGPNNVMSVIENVEIFNSAFQNAFQFICGARLNTLRKIRISGHYHDQAANLNGSLARFICSDTANPIYQNRIEDARIEGIGPGNGSGELSNAAIVFDTTATIGTSNAAAILANKFEDISLDLNDTAAGTEACLFGVQDSASSDRTAAADFSHEDILEQQLFYGNTVRNRSPGNVAFVYCGCGVFEDAVNNARDSCDSPIVGAGAAGADPHGCLNLENGSSPSIQDCS